MSSRQTSEERAAQEPAQNQEATQTQGTAEKKGLLKRIALVVTAFTFALVVAEIAVRISGVDLNDGKAYQYHSTYGWVLGGVRGFRDDANELGFRYPQRKPGPKSANERRVVLLGDSFTEAAAYRRERTFAGRLERSLNQADKDYQWEVYNLGIGDWGQAQEWLALKGLGLDLDPDVVVVQVFPFNDVANNSLSMAGVASLQDDHRPYFVEDEGRLRLTSRSPLRTTLRTSVLFGSVENLFRESRRVLAGALPHESRQRLIAHYRKKADDLALPDLGAVCSLIPEPHQPEPIRLGWQITEALLRKMAESLPSEIPLIGLVVPYSKTFERDWFDSITDKAVHDYGTARVEKIFDQLGVKAISVRGEIEASPMKAEDYFRGEGDSHFNAFGHSEVGRWIHRAVHDHGLVKARIQTPVFPSSVLSRLEPDGVMMRGFGPPRSHEGQDWRMGLGPQTVYAFGLEERTTMHLRYRFSNPLPAQTAALLVNGVNRGIFRLESRGEAVEGMVVFEGLVGRNEIRLVYRDWNHKREAYYPARRDEIALRILEWGIDFGVPSVGEHGVESR